MTKTEVAQLQSTLTTAHHDFGKMLNSYAFYKTSSREVGEDLVQNAFIKTWKYLIKGGKIDSMKSFLYHILNNLVIDEYRKHKTSSLDALLEKDFEPSSKDSGRIFDVLDGKEAFLLIPNLPEKYKKVMHMKYVQYLSLKEMSLITGQSKNTVAVQAHRGLKKLKLLHSHV